MFNGAGGDRYVVSQWINVASYDKLRVQFQFRVGNSDWRLTTTCSGPDWDTNYPLFQYAVVSGTWNTVTSYGRMSTWAEEDYRITTNGATQMQLKWFQDDQAGCSLTINYALWGIDYVRLTGINCNFFSVFPNLIFTRPKSLQCYKSFYGWWVSNYYWCLLSVWLHCNN